MENKSLQKVIAKAEYEKGKTFLEEIETDEKRHKDRRANFTKWIAAASVLLLVGLGVLFLVNQNKAVNAETLYASYYEAYPNNLKPVVRGNTDPLTEAFLAYENQQYTQASKQFQELLKENDNQNLRFYYALSLLSQDDAEKALQQFNSIAYQEHRYYKEIRWYSALAQLKLSQPTDAKKNLRLLNTDFPAYKSKEVRQLLKKLK